MNTLLDIIPYFLIMTSGRRECRHSAGRVLEWDPSLQRETPDQQVRVAKDPEDVLQKKEVLHQATHRGGKIRKGEVRAAQATHRGGKQTMHRGGKQATHKGGKSSSSHCQQGLRSGLVISYPFSSDMFKKVL